MPKIKPKRARGRGRPPLSDERDTVSWSLRMPPALLDRLFDRARVEGEGAATLARGAIRAYLDRVSPTENEKK